MKSQFFLKKVNKQLKSADIFSQFWCNKKNGFDEIALKLSVTSRNLILKTLASKMKFRIFSWIRKLFQARVLKKRFLDFLLNFKAILLKPFYCCTKIGMKCQLISAVCLLFSKKMMDSFFYKQI